MTDFANGKIQAFVGPQELGAANNLEEVIIEFIAGAQKYLDIAVQELDSKPIALAILDAHYRGVNVRLFLEQDYLISNRRPKVRPNIGDEDIHENRTILNALLRSSIDVKADYNPKIFHQKFIIRDYRRSAMSTSAVLTGSTNFTQTGTHKNFNHVIIFNDYRVCREYRVEFDEIRCGNFGSVNSQIRDIPTTINIEGVPVRVLFAPDHTPELEIVKQMLKAQNRLEFAIFTFSGSSAIDDAVIMLRAANRKIRGVMDPSQGKQWWASTDWLHNEGIQVFFPRKHKAFGKLHHKLMVIDDSIVVAGSMNYTAPANEYNDENIFVLGSPYDLPKGKGGPVDHAACAEIAHFFRAEIERIIDISDPYQSRNTA